MQRVAATHNNRATPQAENPILTTHPINGGDALIFSITPPPPQWWWRALRRHATADSTLVRTWDQEHDDRIAVVCPPLDQLPDVIDAIDTAVQASNRDYDAELALQRESAVRLEHYDAQRDQYHSDIRRAIDTRYDPTRGDAAAARRAILILILTRCGCHRVSTPPGCRRRGFVGIRLRTRRG